jgi:predicted RNA-binding protein with PUA-like domain
MKMSFWLIKSEPDAYSFAQMLKDKKSDWTGVRNYQAANNLKAMKAGDTCFFYHSNEGKEIVGVVEVTGTYRPDPTDETGKFGMVVVGKPKAAKNTLTLATIKEHANLKNMAFVKQSRLSVSPVTANEAKTILKLIGLA